MWARRDVSVTCAGVPVRCACATAGARGSAAAPRPAHITHYSMQHEARDTGLDWAALQWADGTRYEGLTKQGKMHSHGVLTFPNKDRYEGQFEEGAMHGAGVYVWSNGTVYRGDWMQGTMHGCGTLLRKQPDGHIAAGEGKFAGNEFVGDVMPCSASDGYEAAVDADVASYQARSFTQWRQAAQPQAQRPRQVHRQQAQPRQPSSTSGSIAGLDEGQAAKLEGLVQRLAALPTPQQGTKGA